MNQARRFNTSGLYTVLLGLRSAGDAQRLTRWDLVGGHIVEPGLRFKLRALISQAVLQPLELLPGPHKQRIFVLFLCFF